MQPIIARKYRCTYAHRYKISAKTSLKQNDK